MNDRQTLATLNELHAIENFSLANYLRYAKPWVAAADQRLDEAIRHIADEQMESSDRVGSLIIERRGHVEGGSFPMRFTAFNDLSVAYLAPRVMADQERIVREVGAVARQLCSDPAAYDLSNEILSAEHAHLDSLRDVIDGRKSGTCHNHEVARPSEPCCEKPNTAVATAA